MVGNFPGSKDSQAYSGTSGVGIMAKKNKQGGKKTRIDRADLLALEQAPRRANYFMNAGDKVVDTEHEGVGFFDDWDEGVKGKLGLEDNWYDEFKPLKKTKGKAKKNEGYGRCFESHPALKINKWEVFGGSCITPIIMDADIYIGFDSGFKPSRKSYPWNEGSEIYFPVMDFSVPKDPEEYKKLVEWTAKEIRKGKKIHAGCIGGHGRTGMFLSALVAHMTEEANPIKYVRDNYCDRVVEGVEQVDFLVKHFGCKQIKGSKSSSVGKSHLSVSHWDDVKGVSKLENSDTGNPCEGPGNIWGSLVK